MSIIQYLYTGETSVANNAIKEFLDTAKKLQILGLCDDNEFQTDNTYDSSNDDDNSNIEYLHENGESAEFRIPCSSASTTVSKCLRSSPPNNDDRSKVTKHVRKIKAPINVNNANIAIDNFRRKTGSVMEQTTKSITKQKHVKEIEASNTVNNVNIAIDSTRPKTKSVKEQTTESNTKQNAISEKNGKSHTCQYYYF